MKANNPKPVVKMRLEMVKKDGKVESIVSTKKRRFLSRLQGVAAQNVALYKLSVSYGLILNNEHRRVIAKNEGEYQNIKDLMFAYRIFTDPREISAILQ